MVAAVFYSDTYCGQIALWDFLPEFQLTGGEISALLVDGSENEITVSAYYSLGMDLKLDFNAVILSVNVYDDLTSLVTPPDFNPVSPDMFEAYATDLCFTTPGDSSFASVTLTCEQSDDVLEVYTFNSPVCVKDNGVYGRENTLTNHFDKIDSDVNFNIVANLIHAKIVAPPNRRSDSPFNLPEKGAELLELRHHLPTASVVTTRRVSEVEEEEEEESDSMRNDDDDGSDELTLRVFCNNVKDRK
eukprot:gene24617-30985_t